MMRWRERSGEKPVNRAVFLDRDGVLNALVYRPEEDVWESPHCPEEFRLLPGAAQAVGLIKEMAFLAIIVSNQPGVAKGKCTIEFLDWVDHRLQQELAREGTSLDAIYYCYHHPHGTVEPYSRICDCRKPKPGLLLRAAQEYDVDLRGSYLVGDRMVDLEAGQAAGCKTILVEKSPAAADVLPDVQHIWVVDDLRAAVRQIRQWEDTNGDLPGLS